MKQAVIVTVIVCLFVSFFLISCSKKEKITDNDVNANTVTSESLVRDEEINRLKKENIELIDENNDLKNKIELLEKTLEEREITPEFNNYRIVDLLWISYTENSPVDMFPGKLQSIRLEETDEAIYFIFSIDRMAVNPNWDGPGSDGGRGFFINSEEKYEDYKGRLDTIFMNKGYENYQVKMESVLSEYGYNNIYNFYMIGDEIVFVDHDPGP